MNCNTTHYRANSSSVPGDPTSFNKQFELAILRSVRNHSGLALMILDIDHFKAINDTLGHAAGDMVLKEFGARLGAAVRRSDVVFRLAGDEFTIILEGIDSPAECATVARKVLDAMRAPFQVEGQARQVSTSIGITWHGGQESTVQLLSEQADAALYRAKAAGRNRFEIS